VACVDLDVAVAMCGGKLACEGVKGVSVVRADFHDPEAVLAGPGVREVVDLAEPVCVILGLVLHYLPVARAREIAAGYAQRIAPGSIVIITTRGSMTTGCSSGSAPDTPGEAAQSHACSGSVDVRRPGAHPPRRETGRRVPAGLG
jgi:hypothetical protein